MDEAYAFVLNQPGLKLVRKLKKGDEIFSQKMRKKDPQIPRRIIGVDMFEMLGNQTSKFNQRIDRVICGKRSVNKIKLKKNRY